MGSLRKADQVNFYKASIATSDAFFSCLAPVINIATQKLISGYSKSLHYNPHEPHTHVPNTDDIMRDEIGLLRAIVVKVRDF